MSRVDSGELRSPPREAAEAAGARAALRAVRAGDREAFGRLLELYQRRLFGLTLMITRDPEGAEEVTQDAFVRAYTHLDHYDEQRPLYPWLATIAARLAQNWLRRRGRVQAREGAPLDPHHPPVAATDPLDRLLTDERGRRLWQAVAALSSGERTAVMLRYRQGLKVREVAAALGVTAGTVKTLLYRARRKLRQALEAQAAPTTTPSMTDVSPGESQ